eukprot:11162013-Lingulodinium_polyedra.AAC.1
MLGLADRWVTKEDCRNHAPKDYGFEPDANGWTASTSIRAAIHLAQATDHAKKLAQQRLDLSTSAQPALGPQATRSLRDALEAAYAAINHGEKPRLRLQPSDAALAKVYRKTQAGRLPILSLAQ